MIGLAECIVVGHLFPIARLSSDLLNQGGGSLPQAFAPLIRYVTPTIIAVLLLSAFSAEASGKHDFEPWARVTFGWTVAATPLVLIGVGYAFPTWVKTSAPMQPHVELEGRSSIEMSAHAREPTDSAGTEPVSL